MKRLFQAYHSTSNSEGQQIISVPDLGRVLRECRIYDNEITREAALQIILSCCVPALEYWLRGLENDPDPASVVQSSCNFHNFFKVLSALGYHKAKVLRRQKKFPMFLQELFTNLVTRCPKNNIKFELILPEGFD